jgi:hypothetical protein
LNQLFAIKPLDASPINYLLKTVCDYSCCGAIHVQGLKMVAISIRGITRKNIYFVIINFILIIYTPTPLFFENIRGVSQKSLIERPKYYVYAYP